VAHYHGKRIENDDHDMPPDEVTRQAKAREYAERAAARAGLMGSQLHEEARLIAAEALGGPAYDWDRLRRVPATDYAKCVRLAQKQDRRHPYPIKAFTISRKTGAVVGVIGREVVRRQPGGRTATRSRTRSRTRATASRGDPDDPSPLAPRPCLGCGESFTPKNPRQRHHDGRCRKRAFDARVHANGGVRPSTQERLRDAVVAQISRGTVSPYDGLLFVLKHVAAV
jgi:hypothetical protein